MSSDDDDREEELLQRALKEQAERDLHYARPPNYPPPLVSPAAAAPPPARPAPSLISRLPPKRTPPPPASTPLDDDEEESEVELLSISSEDDDDAPPSRRPPARAKKSKDEEDDLDWDDEDAEPDRWKRVDEAELRRRVRELRETRSVTSAYQGRIRKGVTYNRKTTAGLDIFSRGDNFMDPLGLGVVDIKGLTLMTDNMSSSVSEKGNTRNVSIERTEDDLMSPSQASAFRERILYHSESFDPKFFLSCIHKSTSAVDLEAGEQALKVDLQSRKQQLKQLVKENFDCFVSCKNTIDDIHSKLQQIEKDPEGAGTTQLNAAILDVDKVANRAFGPLFERQVQVERIRSVQGMLQRFRTLFNLPSAIRTNISKGEYDLAVREYKKAKSIVLPTHAGILRRVLEEVEKVVEGFKEKLYKSMENPQLELSQLESTIRLLLELEPESDPVWFYLNIQSNRIQALLDACSVEHETHMDALHERLREKMQSDAQWKQLQRESSKASEVDYSLLLGEQDAIEDMEVKDSNGKEDALLCELIKRLTAVVVQHVPTFWRLAVAIFNGKFAKLLQGGPVNGILESSGKYKATSGNYGNDEKTTEMKCTSHSLDEVASMVDNIISLYTSKVLNAFLALAESNALWPYMRETVEEISKACVLLENKDSAPSSAVQELFILRTEVTRVFILHLCSFMRSATLDLVNEEDWMPVTTIERGNSPFAISALPLRFRSMMMSSMEHMKEMIERLKADASEFHDMGVQVRQMQDSIRSTFFESFLSFKESLTKISSEISKNSQEQEAVTANGKAETVGDRFLGLQAGVEVTNSHQKLLMILSNIGYCKNVLLPDLSRKYKHVWTQHGKVKGGEEDGSTMEDEVLKALTTLEENLIGQYTYSKAALIGTAAAAYLLEDGIQWGGAPPVKGIRDAAVELLHPLIAVHAEVYSGSRPFLEMIISILIEGLIEALLNVFNENKSKALRILDINGFCQIILEMDYVETVLQSYITTAAHDGIKSIRDLLRGKALDTVTEIETLGHRRSTRGSEDGFEDRLQNSAMSSEELIALERQVCADFLQAELKRTRLNNICFMEARLEADIVSDISRRAPPASSASVAGPILHRTSYASSQGIPMHRRRPSGSSLSDSDSGKMFAGLPPNPPATFHQSGYASSDVGSEVSTGDTRSRTSNSERHMRFQLDGKRSSRRRTFGLHDDDLR